MTVRRVDARSAAALVLAVVLAFGTVGGRAFASDDEEQGQCRRRAAWLRRAPDSARRLRPSSAALVGHWSSINRHGDGEDLFLSSPGDLIHLRKQPAAPRYTWGGPPWGLQLDRDGHAQEFHNVLCSEETDPRWDRGERWTIDNDGNLVIEGPRRRVRAAVEVVDRRRLDLRVLEVCDYSGD